VVRLDRDETFLDAQREGCILLPALRDRERTAIKVRYAYGNDASRALDILRAAVLLNSPEALHAALGAFETGLRQAKWEIAGATDRIKNPTPGGYRDLLLYLRLPNDFICTLQFQLYPMLAAKAQAHPLYVEARRIVARASATQPYSVLICDLFNYQMEEEEFVLGGFSSLEQAREFARRWVRDSVEELRAKGRKREEHRLLWLLFGEDALVIEDAYAGSDELDLFLAEPASQAETDWRAILPET
jgi:hypothetical protein